MQTRDLSFVTPAMRSHPCPPRTIMCRLFLLIFICLSGTEASSWENLTLTGDVISPRCDHSMVRIGDEYFIYGGRSVETNVKSMTQTSESYDDLYMFSHTGNTVRKLTPSGTLPPKLFGHTALVHNRKMYVFFGYKGPTSESPASGPTNDVYRYDPETNQWTKVNPAGNTPSGRLYSAGIDSVTRIWVAGGTRSATKTMTCDDSWVFDPNNETWTRKGDIPQTGRYGHSMVRDTTGAVYILGGRNDYGVQYYAWKYNPRLNQWEEALPQNSPPPVSNSANIDSFTRTGQFYRIGGYGYPSSFSKNINKNEWEKIIGEVWRLDLSKMKWEYEGDIPATAFAAGAFFDDPEDPDDVPVPIIFGGLDANEEPVGTMTLYDPEGSPPTSSVGKETLRWYE